MPLRFIPKKLRHSYYRKSATRAFRRLDDVVFKVATTKQELEDAFRLVYTIYLKKKLINANSSEMHFSKIHSLPTTKILIAVQNNKVVSALCLSLEGPIRTLCEEHFELNVLRAGERRFVEASGFVVDPFSKEDFRSFLFPLCKLSLELNKIFFKADYLIAPVPSESFDYWHSLFLFEKFSEKSIYIQDLGSKSVVCASGDFKDLEKKFLHRYGRKPIAHNLHSYLFLDSDSRIQIPELTDIIGNKYSAEMLNYFFNIQTNIFANLTSFESRTLQKIYDEPEYSELLPQIGMKTKFENHRNVKRHHAHLTGELQREDSEASSIMIKTVSLSGVGAICNQKLSTDKTYQMKIDIGDKNQIALLVSPVWSSRDNTYGFVIRGQNAEWVHFIDSLSRLEKQAS